MTANETDRLLEIGRLGKAHGLNGAIRVWLYNSDTSLDAGTVIYVGDEQQQFPRKVLSLRPGGRFHVMTLEGLAHRDQCELLKNQLVYVRRSDLPELEEEEFYVSDLIGLEVRDGDVVVGTVQSSRSQGEIEMLQVGCAGGDLELPMTEKFIEKLDIPGGRIHARDTEFLFKQEAIKSKSSLK